MIFLNFLVRGFNLQKHHDCSHRSTSTNFGPGLDMTIIYQFSRGSQDGLPLWQPFWTNSRWPPSGVRYFNNFRTSSALNSRLSTTALNSRLSATALNSRLSTNVLNGRQYKQNTHCNDLSQFSPKVSYSWICLKLFKVLLTK